MRTLPKFVGVAATIAAASAACTVGPATSQARSGLPRDLAPAVSTADLRELVEANNAFGLDLFHAVRGESGNLVFSPFSISTAFAMTYAGARGDTESQMADALHFDLRQAELHRAFNQLDLDLAEPASAGTTQEQPLVLRVANSIWVEETLSLLQEYLDTIAVNYGAGVNLADFLNGAESARREINAWVRDRTEKRIQELLPEGALDSTTRMVLVNAIYFKADWTYQFDVNDTAPGTFQLLDGSRVQVEMMSNDLPGVAYAAGQGYQAIELPYSGGRAVMDIIVPDQGAYEAFELSFDEARYDAVVAALQPAALHLVMPKFTFGFGFDLKRILTDLGLELAFDPDQADFSGMTGGRDLYITRALHQAFVAVDEKGTEAAAATAVIMGPTSIMLPDLTMVIDRPFLFLIRDLETGQILFIGRVLNPAE